MNILRKYNFILKGLDCANCANKIQDRLLKEKDLRNVRVNFNTLKLTYEAENENREKIQEIINLVEPNVEILDVENKNSNLKIFFQIMRLICGILFAIIAVKIQHFQILSRICLITAYMILLYRTIYNAVKLFRKSKNIDENCLVTISCIGAYLVGEYFEGLMVIILYEIGKILEEKAINKTRKSITDLMNIKPEYANLKVNNQIKKVAPTEVNIGDTIVIKQGEKIPLDGIVINGNANLDTSSLTGESKLKYVSKDENILSGSINVEGLIEVKVSSKYENSTVNKILELVENATDRKTKTETFVDKASKIYTPIVIGIAVLIAIFLPLISNIKYGGGNGSIYRALIFLVISCPCAIAISVPLSYFFGIGKASRKGILIKGSDYLDSLKDIKQMIFDKTGTLTQGKFEISDVKIYNKNYTKNDILRFAVIGEKYSNHPIAKSIIDSAKLEISDYNITQYKEIAGKGISYKYNENTILLGNSEFVNTTQRERGTPIFVKCNEDIIGCIVLNDLIKKDAKFTLSMLKTMGIKIKIFTGDNLESAYITSKILGISDIKAEMLPTDKYNEMEKLLSNKGKNEKIAFVGDGINDSPVIALSDIGISMGGVGSQSTIEASDVVITSDNIEKIIDAINISKKTCKIIKQNLIFAIFMKMLVLICSAFGITGMWEAIFADVGVTLITILNIFRI